jgi:hypothetical protein
MFIIINDKPIFQPVTSLDMPFMGGRGDVDEAQRTGEKARGSIILFGLDLTFLAGLKLWPSKAALLWFIHREVA